ncbi:MAG: hypothetical protein JW932_18785 [Deltaproteobacteria bacterium]|nr:hypothetical protein [Deltaproteobacteria bacterium]
MTHEDRGHYAGKHPADLKVKPEILEAVREKASGQEISCAAAFSIVDDLQVTAREVGAAVDINEISIAKCQLGLFGYGPEKRIVKPADHVSPDLEKAIREVLTNNRLSCKDAWELAKRFGMKKMEISSACEALGIKIQSCQLGAFK